MSAMPDEELIETVMTLVAPLPPQPFAKRRHTAAIPALRTLANPPHFLPTTIPPHTLAPSFFVLELISSVASKIPESPSNSLACPRILLERAAHGKPERRHRIEVIQPPRIVLNEIQLQRDLKRIDRRIDGAERILQKELLGRINVWLLGHQLLVQAVQVVSVIDPERRLNNREL